MILLMVLLALAFLPGCATANYGKSNVTTFDITMPSDLVGQDKESIMKTLGDPDFVTTDQNIEYWGYKNHNGWYFNLYYISGGKTDARDLIVEFSSGKVKTTYLIDKGSSIGIFAAPQAVAN
jgi:outer membrane protein assembly factor BamE (lipoprotein component of BamABCDE complex)